MHVRAQVRHAVVAALKAAATAAGDRVYAHRVHDLGAEQMPACAVATTDESAALAANDDCDKIYDRTLTVTIDCYALGADADDQADALAAAVETALEADPSLGGVARDLSLTQTNDIYAGDGERIAGRKRLSYAVRYATAARVPQTAIF